MTEEKIGYIHKLSPLKQGKKKPWCEMQLQTEKERIRVVCFSKCKRYILAENQKPDTSQAEKLCPSTKSAE